jgi:hypothetical protein
MNFDILMSLIMPTSVNLIIVSINYFLRAAHLFLLTKQEQYNYFKMHLLLLICKFSDAQIIIQKHK